jgi:hypothetical protein
MRYSVTYPNTFSPEKLFAHQSPVPSQYSEMANWPFDPSEALGVWQTQKPGDAVFNTGYTVYTYDSRPPQSMDFYTDLPFIPDNLEPYASSWGSFRVPQGYTFILRRVELQVFAILNDATFPLAVNIVGQCFPAAPFIIGITINGGRVSGYDLIDASQAIASNFEIDCFVPCLADYELSLSFPAGFTGTATAKFYGNLLFATGRDLQLEFTAPSPVPVEIKNTEAMT